MAERESRRATDAGPRQETRRTDDSRPPRSRVDALGAWLRPRARLVGGGAAVGVVAGLVAMAALTLSGDARSAEATGFAFGALALGFGVVGWSGSVVGGRSFETMQRHLDTGTNWTERDSRRAMARIAGFGAGVMTGVSLLAAAL